MMTKRIFVSTAFSLALLFLAVPAYSQPTLTAETNRVSMSTFPLGEPVTITFSAAGLEAHESALLNLEVKNEFGKKVLATNFLLKADEDGNASTDFNAPATKLGYYEVAAALSNGATLPALGSRPEGMISYAVVPDPATRVDYGDAGSRFGMQGGFSKSVPVLPYLGVRYVLSGNDWGKSEPQAPGQFTTLRYEADKAGKKFPPANDSTEGLIYNGVRWATYPVSLLTSAALPDWALKSGSAGTTCKKFGSLNEAGEKALPAFAQAQAKAFASDYKNMKSRFYQVTWEPATGWCFGGSPQELVEFYAKTYAAIHQADPHALVAGPTLFIEENATKQLEGLWAAGLGKYIDALSIHPYAKAWPPETNGFISILRAQLNMANQAVGHTLPFIGTEHGFKSKDIGNLNKAMGDIRSTLILLGEGASFDFAFYVADFWDGQNPAKSDGYGFYWNLNPKIVYGTDKLGPKPIVPAYAAMTFLLDGSTSKGAVQDVHGTQMGYRFVQSNTEIEAVWDYGAESFYTVPQGASVCDWMGNCAAANAKQITLTGAPTYIVIKTKA